jgi:hypothetical protein
LLVNELKLLTIFSNNLHNCAPNIANLTTPCHRNWGSLSNEFIQGFLEKVLHIAMRVVLPPHFGGQWLQSPLLDGLFSEYVLLGLSINKFWLLIVSGVLYKVSY